MSFGMMGTDREERINYERMREYRLARTREQMEKFGIGTLVSWEAWDIRYISGAYVTVPTRWIEGQYCILPRNGDPHVFAFPSFSPYAVRKKMPWLKDKIWAPASHIKLARTVDDLSPVVNQIADVIAEHGLTNEPVGLDGTQSELLLQEAFGKKGIKIVDAKPAMFQARKIKNQDEIECCRMACTISDAAFTDMRAAIKPGVKECELMGIGMNRLYALGCDETMEFVVASGPRTNPLWIDYTDRMVHEGDHVIIDINGASFNGYKSCYYRTFVCGKATQQQKETYEECRAMMYAGMSGIKAGNTTWDVCKNWPDSPQYWGYDNWDEVMGYALGHGLGISLHEFPFMFPATAKDNPVTLEEGMVLAIENWTGKKDGGKDGVRLEENIVVTKDGYELLTNYPVDELIECPL
jgi:Xaa-Pro aminopeptidase